MKEYTQEFYGFKFNITAEPFKRFLDIFLNKNYKKFLINDKFHKFYEKKNGGMS